MTDRRLEVKPTVNPHVDLAIDVGAGDVRGLRLKLNVALEDSGHRSGENCVDSKSGVGADLRLQLSLKLPCHRTIKRNTAFEIGVQSPGELYIKEVPRKRRRHADDIRTLWSCRCKSIVRRKAIEGGTKWRLQVEVRPEECRTVPCATVIVELPIKRKGRRDCSFAAAQAEL